MLVLVLVLVVYVLVVLVVEVSVVVVDIEARDMAGEGLAGPLLRHVMITSGVVDVSVCLPTVVLVGVGKGGAGLSDMKQV